MCFLADEDFAFRIVKGLRQHQPDVDILTVQEAGLTGAEDSVVLDWAATQGRVMLSHDVSTMSVAAYQRLAMGVAMPGLLLVSQDAPYRAVLDDLLMINVCGRANEYHDRVGYLPL